MLRVYSATCHEAQERGIPGGQPHTASASLTFIKAPIAPWSICLIHLTGTYRPKRKAFLKFILQQGSEAQRGYRIVLRLHSYLAEQIERNGILYGPGGPQPAFLIHCCLWSGCVSQVYAIMITLSQLVLEMVT